jgi:hypothetical protein
MTEISFNSLQDRHERLLQKQPNLTDDDRQAFIEEVREYIEDAKSGGSFIPSNRDRDQLRANLRYWANYLYGIDGAFPGTELAPAIARSRPFYANPAAWIWIAVFAGAALLSVFLFRNQAATVETTPTPPLVSETDTPIMEQPPETEEPPETPTQPSPGFNVTLSSPENGEFITPNLEFSGTFDNLKAGWAIHVLFIREGRYFPLKENFAIPEKPENNEWTIRTRLTENPEEMAKAQSYSIVLAVSTNEATREMLSQSSEEGFGINSLPDNFLAFDGTARVIYRDPFKVIRETRIVYSFYDGASYELYSSRLDGSDVTQITFTPEYSEMFPSLSPDGTKIAYVKRIREPAGNARTYAISIMDSNGGNDREITERSRDVIESPQWSPDSAYIAYTKGEFREASNRVFWSVRAYDLASGEDNSISGAPQQQAGRYAAWIPDTNILIFDAAISDRTRFLQAPPEFQEHSLYFDPMQYVSQPGISPLGDGGHLLVYTVIGPAPEYLHDIYAAIDLDGQIPFDSEPILLIRSGGEVVDYPKSAPDANILFYARSGAIFRIEYQVEGSQITLVRRPNIGPNGELVVQAGPTREAIHFDINFMDAFFPIR